MQLTLGEIADRLGGELTGDREREVCGVAGIAEADSGEITFLANPKYAPRVAETRAAAVIVSRDFAGPAAADLLKVDDPYLGFLEVLKLFSAGTQNRVPGVHPAALVDPSARVGREVSLGAFCVVEAEASIGDRVVLWPGAFVGRGTAIGEDSVIHANAVLRERVTVGRRVIVHAGAVIGSDGFGYAPRDGRHEKIPQVGTVEIGDDVEIGANVTIDRGTMGPTRIGRGVKIDNLVHVAHNVSVGEDSVLVAQVGISGSTQVGRGVTFGGQSGAVGHIRIGDGATVAAQAGVTKSVADGARVSGYPAMEHNRARRLNAHVRRLPDLVEQMKALEERLRALEGESDAPGPRSDPKEDTL